VSRLSPENKKQQVSAASDGSLAKSGEEGKIIGPERKGWEQHGRALDKK
jgi:hypothetical protein